MRIITKLFLSFFIFCVSFSFFLPHNVLAAEDIVRLSGATRYETSVAIAGHYQNGSIDKVILVSGNGFADALSVSVLAHKLNAPILLVDKTPSASSEALDYINTHMEKGTVYIIGGPGVIDSSFESLLQAKGFEIKRIAGSDRYETCTLIAQQISPPQGTPVFIASGENYPDALSIAGIASEKGYPILLTTKTALTEGTLSFLQSLNPTQVFIIGGSGVISNSVQASVEGILPSTTVTRIAGEDRFATSANVYAQFYTNPFPEKIYVSSGKSFADALAASVLASKDRAPIILIDPHCVFPPEPVLEYLRNLANPQVVVLGGEGAVSETLAANIAFVSEGITVDEEGYYQLDATTTADSSLIITGIVPPTVSELYFKVTYLDGAEESVWRKTVVPTNGFVSTKLYLTDGAGNYTICVGERYQHETRKRYILVKQFSVTNTDQRNISKYAFPSNEIQSDHEEIIALAEAITQNAKCDYDKVRAVHDWVAKNIAYDIENLYSGTFVSSAIDTLYTRKSVCQGYANLVAALLRSLGIPTKVVGGVAGDYANLDEIRSNPEAYLSNHVWNEALVDGRWVVFDVTWDAGYVNPAETCFTFEYTTKYFDPQPEIFVRDHVKIEEY